VTTMGREVTFVTDFKPLLILGMDENVKVLLTGRRASVVVQLPPILPPTISRTVVVQEEVEMARTIKVQTGDYGADALRVVKVIAEDCTKVCETFLFDKGHWQHRS